MIAGATPSALAAAVRLPRVAIATKDSSCFRRSMAGANDAFTRRGRGQVA